jgi:hypothetical protein
MVFFGMRFFVLLSVLIFSCSCARVHYVRSAPGFKPIPIDKPLVEREAHFDRHKVSVLGANQAQVAGQLYNAIEIIRYYDDSFHADASALQSRAQAKILRADDWIVFGSAYGSILGLLIGGLSSYFATSNSDFRALDAAGAGALRGVGWGLLGGLAVGSGGFALERKEARRLQIEASEEFNRSARTMLRIRF